MTSLIFQFIGFLFMLAVIVFTARFVHRKHKYNSRGELRQEITPDLVQAAFIKKEIASGRLVVDAKSDSEGKIGLAVR